MGEAKVFEFNGVRAVVQWVGEPTNMWAVTLRESPHCLAWVASLREREMYAWTLLIRCLNDSDTRWAEEERMFAKDRDYCDTVALKRQGIFRTLSWAKEQLTEFKKQVAAAAKRKRGDDETAHYKCEG